MFALALRLLLGGFSVLLLLLLGGGSGGRIILFSQRQADRLHLAASGHGDGEGVACGVLLDDGAQIGLLGHLGAVDADDAVTDFQAGFVGGAALDHIGHIDAVGIDAQLPGRLCIGDTCRSSDIWIICSDGSWCLLRFCDRFLTDKNGDSVHFGGNHRKYRIVYN